VRVAAVDCGATSIRVAVVDETNSVDVLHRFPHQPVVHHDGSLRWNWDRIVAEVEAGLTKALDLGPLDSIGIDTWGVDYGLLDDTGALVAPPFAYRDTRTDNWRLTADRLEEHRLYEQTGIQLMPINTIFQLAAHDPDELRRAARVLMLPELLVFHLTGAVTAEVTSAATTGLVSLHTGDWDDELLAEIDVDPSLFAPIAPVGTRVGAWRDVPVHLVGGHDTASAVFARPGSSASNRAFVSTGSWVLVGVEREQPLTSRMARLANFSNERSVGGGFRLLKNVTGLWLLEQCRAEWANPPVEHLLDAARHARGGIVVNVDDPHIAQATSVLKAIADVSELEATDRGGITRCIFESIAFAVAGVIEQVSHVTGTPVTEIDLLGGGAQIPLLVDLVEKATDLPCTVGSAEATALGNAKAQFAALA
jgi:rhamnulokinase